MSDPFKDWSSWIKEGHFVSFAYEGVQFFEHVIQRDMGHWEYDWPATVEAESDTGGGSR